MFEGLDFGMDKVALAAATGFTLTRERAGSAWLSGTVAGLDATVEVTLGVAPGWEDKVAGLTARFDYQGDEALMMTPIGQYGTARYGAPDELRKDAARWESAWGHITLERQWRHLSKRRGAPATPQYTLRFWNRRYQIDLTAHLSQAAAAPTPIPAPTERREDEGHADGAAAVLGFELGTPRSDCLKAARARFTLDPETDARWATGSQPLGATTLQMTWTFDEAGKLVALSAKTTEEAAARPLSQTALFAALVEGLGAADSVAPHRKGETASWRRGDTEVVYGAVEQRSKAGRGRTTTSYDLQAWSVRHRAIREGRAQPAAVKETQQKRGKWTPKQATGEVK